MELEQFERAKKIKENLDIINSYNGLKEFEDDMSLCIVNRRDPLHHFMFTFPDEIKMYIFRNIKVIMECWEKDLKNEFKEL